MKMKLFRLLLLSCVIGFAACRKEEKLNVNLDSYNIQGPIANTALDQWLKENFLDKYNINVNYRYDHYKQSAKNVYAGPVNVDMVKPQMQAMLDGMIKPYERNGGFPFIARVMPKEINLFGSSEYDKSAGQWLNGIIMGGKEINLYFVNTYAVGDADLEAKKLRTMHHEFTHALNSHEPIPVEFEPISGKLYTAQWKTISEANARAMGFVTPYAASEKGEDIADMVARLLVNGQIWFDDWANGSTAEGKAALKAKESVLIGYFKKAYNIDFKALQREVQQIVRNNYRFNEACLPKWLANGYFKTITINADNDNIYQSHPLPSEFAAIYNALAAGIAAKNAAAQYRLHNVQFRFTGATTLTVKVNYTATAGASNGSTFYGEFNFSYALNAATGATTFVKLPQSAGYISDVFAATLQPYLTQNNFVASWLPANADTNTFNSYGGFYVNGSPNNYFYGLLGQTL